jgi:hypothetical protein
MRPVLKHFLSGPSFFNDRFGMKRGNAQEILLLILYRNHLVLHNRQSLLVGIVFICNSDSLLFRLIRVQRRKRTRIIPPLIWLLYLFRFWKRYGGRVNVVEMLQSLLMHLLLIALALSLMLILIIFELLTRVVHSVIHSSRFIQHLIVIESWSIHGRIPI